MTIGKQVISVIINKFGDNVQPNDNRPTVDAEIQFKTGIPLVTYDILGLLRSTTILKSSCPVTGLDVRMTCRAFVNSVFKTSAFASLLIESVQVVVVCIDRFGARRIEKMATTLSRKRRREDGQPDFIPLPPGQHRYFEDDKPMPGELSDIFECTHIKAEFYEYISQVFASERTRAIIPDGKRLILSCGVHIDPETRAVEVLHPLEVRRDGVRAMEECNNSEISEGDLDAVYWAEHVFPEMDVHVHSYDSDVLLILMMVVRRLLSKNANRKVWFITRRSTESRAPTTREVRQRTLREQRRVITFDTVSERYGVEEGYRVAGKMYTDESIAASSSSSSSTIFRAVPITKDRYFNVTEICKLLYAEANARLSSRGLEMKNPVEVNVLALLLSSDKHDYIQTRKISPGVGTQFVWPAFSNNLWRFSQLIELDIDEKTGQYQYTICMQSLRDFALSIYDEKGSAVIKAKDFPSIQALHKLAAQCVWTMQYWGNGTIPGYKVVDGTTTNADGQSIFGYTSAGWADSVCDDVVIEKMVRCCPLPNEEQKKPQDTHV